MKRVTKIRGFFNITAINELSLVIVTQWLKFTKNHLGFDIRQNFDQYIQDKETLKNIKNRELVKNLFFLISPVYRSQKVLLHLLIVHSPYKVIR